MNIERLTEIRDWLLEGAPERGGVTGFDMTKWQCGTVCCIGGTAQAWYGDKPIDFEDPNIPRQWWIGTGELLGLDADTSEELFFGIDAGEVCLSDITALHAARTIDRLIATGEVDWLGTRTETGEVK